MRYRFFLIAILSMSIALFAEAGHGAQLNIIESNGLTVGSGATTNLPSGNVTSHNQPYLYNTLLSTNQPGSSGTAMVITSTSTSQTAMGKAYYNVAFASSATIKANATGTFVVKSTNKKDNFYFSLWDYNPSGGAVTQIGTTSSSQTGVTNGITTLSASFSNGTYTLTQGHFLMVEIDFKAYTSGDVATLYCNTSYLSYLTVGVQFTVSTNNNLIGSQGTISAQINGASATINGSGVLTANWQDNVALSVTASAGHTITSVTIDGVVTTVNAPTWNSGFGSTTFPAINKNHTFSASFTTVSYSFSISAGVGAGNAGGTISWPTSQSVHNGSTTISLAYGTVTTFTVTPDAGYAINTVIVNGVSQPVPYGQTTSYSVSVTITNSGQYISATFVPTYAVSTSAGPGGTITPAGPTQVPLNQNLTLTIAANPNYRIYSINDSCYGTVVVTSATSQAYTTPPITQACTISATFMRTYTVTISTGPNGTASPLGTVTADAGSSMNIAIEANIGYKVQDVLVNGTDMGAISTVPLNNINQNYTVSATFIASSDLNNYCAMPSFVSTQVPPNVMIMLSVESPMAGVGNPNITCSTPFTSLTATCGYVVDNVCNGTGGPNGSLGCYDDSKDYGGYFDSHKCYTYSGSGTTGLFTATAAATVQASTTNPPHQCSGIWSGNFLNWSTTMALDNFRQAFTGGNRDPNDPQTIVAGRFQSTGWFPSQIRLDNSQFYTPYNGSMYFQRKDIGFGVCNSGYSSCSFGTSTGSGDSTGQTAFPTAGTNMAAAYSLRIKACDSTYGAEGRCNYSYSTPLPEGTIQKYASQMRFGLLDYLTVTDATNWPNNEQKRDGGVLRANIKWVIPTIPYGVKYHSWSGSHYDVLTCSTVGGCPNPEAELDANGNFINNPDGAPSGFQSGVINTINKFGYRNLYKSYDPVGEMFYQAVRYFMNLGPSQANEYCQGETNPTTIDSANDGFAVYCDPTTGGNAKFGWRDYAIYPCARNFLIGIQDANPWLDKRIPGSAFIGNYGGSAASGTDWCGSSQGACDTDFKLNGTPVNVKQWTNTVGDNEGITGAYMNFACEVNDSGNCMGSGFAGWSGQNLTVQQLGRVIHSGREDSYNIAGLAYFAHVNNLRPDLNVNYCNVNNSTKCTTDADCPSGDTCHITLQISHNLTSYLIDTQEPYTGGMTNGPKNELYLAAKYGGFQDKDNNNLPYNSLTPVYTGSNKTDNLNACGSANPPALCSEWDADGDGYPDTYFFASQSSKVAQALDTAFKDMLRRMASGTAASILSNSNGSGATLLQAIFYPEKIFDNQTQVDWIGELQDLWYYVDPLMQYSTIREDTDSDQVLDLKDDYILHFVFDGVETQAQLLQDVKGDGGSQQTQITPGEDPELVKSLWKAGQSLWRRNLSTSPRSLFTTLDGSTLTNFLNLNPNDTNVQAMFQSNNPAEVTNLINYTHGFDIGGYRSRTVTQGSTSNVWKLGDIVSSTPKLLSTLPLNSYHYPPPGGYGDATYKAFIGSSAYASRGLALVGANDGMLHAFNLGVMAEINDNTNPTQKARVTGTNLGQEQWAYIPKGVIPYLRYYADPKYNHIFSVDGPTVVTDVSMTKPSGCSETNYWNCSKAVDSWNTVMIGSMGVGGASAAKGSSCTNCVLTPTMDPYNTSNGLGYSTYFALDVTNANTQPKLLWEFSNPNLGYATAGAAIVKINSIGGSSKNGRWLAILASGPTGGIDTTQHNFLGRSNQDLYLFVLDMQTGALLATIDTGIQYAFAGSITAASIDTARWNKNGGKGFYQDHALYIGYTKRRGSGTSSDPYAWTDGGVLRLVIPVSTNPDNLNNSYINSDPVNAWLASSVIDGIGPVTNNIARLQDRTNHNLWLYFGTGRYFYGGDDPTTQRMILGVKEPCYAQSASHPDGSTSTDDIDDKNCHNSTSVPPPLSLSSLADMTTSNNTSDTGWFINLNTPTSFSYAERSVTDPVALTNGVVFFTTYSPNPDICSFGGNTAMWSVQYSTGWTPPQNSLKGLALVQTSTGAFQEINLNSAFTLSNNRKTGFDITGKPPADPPPIITNANLTGVKKILHIMER